MNPSHPTPADPVIAYVGVGANLGDALETVCMAIEQIAALAQVSRVQSAPLYKTAPIDSHGPDYINTVVRLQTHLPALSLLDALQGIELAHGRTRPYRNAPRTLDLDLLLYGQEQIDTPRLQVPHPRMLERGFVLAPLHDLDTTLIVSGVAVREALARCTHDVVRIDNKACPDR